MFQDVVAATMIHQLQKRIHVVLGSICRTSVRGVITISINRTLSGDDMTKLKISSNSKKRKKNRLLILEVNHFDLGHRLVGIDGRSDDFRLSVMDNSKMNCTADCP